MSEKVTILKLKRRIELFFEHNEDKDIVFAVFEDVDGYIYYYYPNLFEFGERQKMLEQQFYQEFTKID